MAPLLMLEVWEDIAYYLRRPTPPPMEGADRSRIRQPDLATMMRTSVFFNNICGPLLYEAPIVDDLANFVWGINLHPVHPSIPNKTALLGCAKQLHLEYPDLHTLPTFHSLVRFGGLRLWLDLGIERDNNGEFVRDRLAMERHHDFAVDLPNFCKILTPSPEGKDKGVKGRSVGAGAATAAVAEKNKGTGAGSPTASFPMTPDPSSTSTTSSAASTSTTTTTATIVDSAPPSPIKSKPKSTCCSAAKKCRDHRIDLARARVPSSPFTILRTLSLCSLLGHPHGTHMPDLLSRDALAAVQVLRDDLWRLIRTMPRLEHVCAHNGTGPLGVPWDSELPTLRNKHDDVDAPRPKLRVHLDGLSFPLAVLFNGHTTYDGAPQPVVQPTNANTNANANASATAITTAKFQSQVGAASLPPCPSTLTSPSALRAALSPTTSSSLTRTMQRARDSLSLMLGLSPPHLAAEWDRTELSLIKSLRPLVHRSASIVHTCPDGSCCREMTKTGAVPSLATPAPSSTPSAGSTAADKNAPVSLASTGPFVASASAKGRLAAKLNADYFRSKRVNIDIYLTPTRPRTGVKGPGTLAKKDVKQGRITLERQWKVALKAQENLERYLGYGGLGEGKEGDRDRDRVRWAPSDEAPICVACGYLPAACE